VSNLLVGPYIARTSLPAGWQLENAEFDLVPGDNHVVLRAVRQVAARLTATVTFDRDTYAVGDTAHQHVTLTNHGGTDLERVAARCDGTGNGFPGEASGVLKVGFGNGVPIRAGETRTFDFAEVVPERGWRFGHMIVDCVFGGDDYGQNGARVYAKVAVPGGRVTGIVSHEDGPIPNLKLYLVAGPTQPDPDAPPATAPSSPGAAAPQAAVRPANLADTGASVTELSALAVLLLLTGSALLLVRRTPRSR